MKLLALLLATALTLLLLAVSAPRSARDWGSDPQLVAPLPVRGVGSGESHGRTGAPSGRTLDASPESRTGRIGGFSSFGAPLLVKLPSTHIGSAAGTIRGVASYFGTGPAGVAAAGPNLRAALGRDWRGTWVRVSYRGRSAWLRLGDACWCAVADIDIPTRTFSYLSRSELWRGLLRVTITWGDRPALPATSTEDGWKP